MEFRLAKKEDMLDIAYIVCLCFNEPMDSVEFYLNNKFKLDRCAVCVDEGKVVSSLSMLSANIYINGKMCPSNYIYAAATLPAYRNRGCMSKLIDFSCEISKKRGEKYSILLPANDALYNYYLKVGYESFYKIKFLKISNQTMRECILENNGLCVYNSLEECNMYKVRNDICKSINGSVIWDKQSIDYAIKSNEHYGGSTVFIKDGYAICFVDNKKCVQVTEFMTKKENVKDLMAAIYRKYPLMDYNFRVPVNMDILNIDGEVRPFGMIRRICEDSDNFNGCEYPYLGLPLD